jgi:uncharacterized protein YaaQ
MERNSLKQDRLHELLTTSDASAFIFLNNGNVTLVFTPNLDEQDVMDMMTTVAEQLLLMKAVDKPAGSVVH